MMLGTACTNTGDNIDENSDKQLEINEKVAKRLENEKIEEEKQWKLENARNQVVQKYRTERDVLGTGKFIEDTYKKYPRDEIIATIYNYDNAVYCAEISKDGFVSEEEWIGKAKTYASKIDPSYSGPFNKEIVEFTSNLLGE